MALLLAFTSNKSTRLGNVPVYRLHKVPFPLPSAHCNGLRSEIDDIIFEINLAHDAFISAVIFGKKEIEEG